MNTKKMTVMTMALMTVAASVTSLRGLPMMAKEGLSMIFYILFALVMFLLPASLVAAELGGMYADKEGGVYLWVKEALGSKWGFTAIWLQWIQNVVWYPTTLAFAAGVLAYLFMDPALASSGIYTGIVILVVYWISSIIALRGGNFASKVSSWGLILGTILPGLFIMVLALIWIIGGNPIAFLGESTKAAAHVHPTFFPHISGLGSISFLAGIVLLFAGVEVHAVHANELENPSRDYPKAMFIAMIVIVVIFLLGSLSIATVLPAKDISLTAGVMQAFKFLLAKFHIGFLTPVFGLLTAFGAIGGVMSWMTGPSKGILITAKNVEVPPFMAKVNKYGVQKNILLIQGLIVSVLTCLYFITKNVSVAFFLLSAMTVTLYLVMYILMFISAIKLRISKPDAKRSYKIPGGIAGMIIVAGIGLLGVTFSLVVGFVPPSSLPVGNPALYIGLVSAGMIIFVGAPLLINKFKKPEWVKK